MSYNAKNYTEQGGESTHIGGSLIIEEGASVEGLPAPTIPVATTSKTGVVQIGSGLSGVLSADGITPAANQAASTATELADLKNDFNTLLAALKTAGLMTADS